jgi:hypothetical protein
VSSDLPLGPQPTSCYWPLTEHRADVNREQRTPLYRPPSTSRPALITSTRTDESPLLMLNLINIIVFGTLC